MKSTCWDTRATDSIIKSGQKDNEAGMHLQDYDRLARKLEKLMGKTPNFSQLFMKLRV